MDIDEVTLPSSESDSCLPLAHAESDDEFPKLKLSDIIGGSTLREDSSGKKHEERAAEDSNRPRSPISKKPKRGTKRSPRKKRSNTSEPVPSTSNCSTRYNTRRNSRKRSSKNSLIDCVDLCEGDVAPKSAESRMTAAENEIVLISDGSSSNSQLSESKEKKSSFENTVNCESAFSISEFLTRQRNSLDSGRIGDFSSKPAAENSSPRQSNYLSSEKKVHAISENEDSDLEPNPAESENSHEVFPKVRNYSQESAVEIPSHFSNKSDKTVSNPVNPVILPLEDEETRFTYDGNNSNHSIYSKTTEENEPGTSKMSGQDSDVPTEPPSPLTRFHDDIDFNTISCSSNAIPLQDELENSPGLPSPLSNYPDTHVLLSDDSDTIPFLSQRLTHSLSDDSDHVTTKSNPSPSKSDPNISNYNISDVDSQMLPNSEPLPLAENFLSQKSKFRKSPTSRFQAAAERKRQKELKERKKAEKAALAEVYRRIRPGECMKYITAIFDSAILSEHKWASQVFENLQSSGSFKSEKTVSADPYSVRWVRQQVEHGETCEEKHLLFLWSAEQLFTSIKFGTLLDNFTDVRRKYNNYKVYIAVYGLKNYYRNQQRAAKKRIADSQIAQTQSVRSRNRKNNFDIDEEQVEMELIALQLRLGISHKFVDSVQEVESFVQELTKSIAELPFKLEREKMDMERNWYAKGDSRNCVRIDKDFNGMKQLWLQQLSQFNCSSLDTAKAIAEFYPTPLALYNAYQCCTTEKEKHQLLQDIVVKRGAGNNGRRLGPELSRKISILFTQKEDISLG